MKKLSAFLIIFIAILGCNSNVFAEDQNLLRAIVILEEGADTELLYNADLEILEFYDNVSAASIKASEDTLSSLAAVEGVKLIEKDAFLTGNAQLSGWGIPLINSPVSWNSGYTGKNVRVGVIDSGISPHPDLRIAGGVSIVDYTSSYYDDNGHGTHVAGIIGALDNSIGIKGVAPESDLYAIKVFSENNTGYLSDVISGIDWAITNKMDIINLSLGAKEGSALFQDIIRKAAANNILIIAAAGNDGFEDPTGDLVEYPARYKEVIAVSAIDNQSKRAFFSAAGPAVDLTAPGLGIRSTYLNNGYMDMSGTSMAAPFVAGQAALVKQAYPGLSNEQVRSILSENAIDLGVPGIDPIFGAGLIQAQAYMAPEYGMFAAKNPVTSVVPSKLSLSANERTAYQLKANAKLSDGMMIDITNSATWSSSDPAIATVDKGNLYLLKQGTTIIEIKYNNLVATVNIKVTAAPEAAGFTFTDVSAKYWAHDEIQKMVTNKVIKGYPDLTFRPETFIRRANAAVMLNRILDLPIEREYTPFADVPDSHPYFDSIKAVQQAGIFSGNEAGFDPAGELTRAQMAKILVEAFDLSAPGSNPFPDAQKNWAKEYIDVLYATGITTGSNGMYLPERKVKRSELAVFMSRAYALQEGNTN